MQGSNHRPGRRSRRRTLSALVALLGLTAVTVVALPAAAGGSQGEDDGQATSALWDRVEGKLPATQDGAKAYVRPDRFRAFELDRAGLAAALERAPRERSEAARQDPLVLSLPAPGGGFQRFELVESPVMEPGLAAKHPEISTYRGRGLDDSLASIRADLTPLGFHASVRSPAGNWYVDPYYHLDDSLYISYFVAHLSESPHGTFVEREDEANERLFEELQAKIESSREAGPSTGPQLRTYRLALVTDPTYSTFFGGPANVTAAKVTLLNRVTQIYEDETSIRLVYIANNDLLNLDTPALMTGANGPCGETPCYTPAQATSCGGATLTRTRIVIGQIIGAANFDIGHIGLGNPGGGVASFGVGGNPKAQGCTGLSTPVGDYFAVDYVAHEMGHQFFGNHTFDGNQVNCAGGNRSQTTSVEPGSGSSIMAYAGICRQDNIQPNSDPYWSQRSFEEITTYVSSVRPPINEVQTTSLDNFSGGAAELQTVALSSFGATDSFQLTYEGGTSATLSTANYTIPGVETAIEDLIPGAGDDVTVTNIGGAGGTLSTAGFDVTFGGTLANTDVSPLGVVGTGMTGTVTEAFNGGPTFDSFTITYEGTTSDPIVHGSTYTIPFIQSQFEGTELMTVSLSGYDANGDSYTLRQNGNDTVPIVRGQNDTVAGIQNALQGGNEQQQAILGSFNGATQSFQVQIGGNNSAVLGAGGLAISNANVAAAVNGIAGFAGTVTSSGAGNGGFTLTFGGASANTDVPSISIVNCTAPCTSSVRELAKGGGPMAGWPAGGTVSVGSLSDAGYTLLFGGSFQGVDVDPFTVENGTGGTTGTVTETSKGGGGLLPAGATATIVPWSGGGALNDAGFAVTFGGSLAGQNLNSITLTNLTGLTGFVGETAKGGPIDNQGNTVTPTGNAAPVVAGPAAYTIPTRTPFALTGNAIDPDGDAVTYMWEQNDRGVSGGTGTALVNPNKTAGPLFRQFGTALDSSVYNPALYNSPGENHPTTDPTRVFPDMPQVLADNTNAETGNCPGPPVPPSPPSGGSNVPQPQIDCYSEFLPTAAWVGFPGDRVLHFRLTARDGEGGVASPTTDTALTIAPAAGPFLVTSYQSPTSVAAGANQTITWDVANTNAAPVSTANVRITMSTDGGATFPVLLAASTPNDGSHAVTVPNTGTTQGRIKIEAVGNVFFDVSDGNLTIQTASATVSNSGSATVEYSDAIAPDLTVSASDADSAGSGLTASATGLPAGMSLAIVATSADPTRPGTRTWRVAGSAAGPPGTHNVTVTVTDEVGHQTTTQFTITVSRADAVVTYDGDTSARTRAGRSTAPVTLRASVVDGAVAPGTPDDSPGDIRRATVTFMEGSAILCGPVPVQSTNAANTTGAASCTVPLRRGAHDVQVNVGDWYTGSTTARIQVRQLPACGVALTPGRLVAGQRTRVRAAVRLSGGRYGDARVRFRGPGINRTVGANRSGVATLVVRPSRAGTLRATVLSDASTIGCADTSRIRGARSGTAGAAAGGGPALTGRPN